MKRHLVSCLAATCVVACGTATEPAPAPDPAPSTSSSPEPTRETILGERDARSFGPAIRQGVSAGDAALRREAVEALGMLRDPSSEVGAALLRSLRDTDPAIRAVAFRGLVDRGSAPVRPLAGALAAETDDDARAVMLRAIGRLGDLDALETITPSLRSERPSDREAACLGIGERALAGHAVPTSVRASLAAHLTQPEPAEVRLACTYALARLPVAEIADAAGVPVALGLAIADVDADVRVYAARAFGRLRDGDLEPLRAATEDSAWIVQVAAFNALGVVAPAHDDGPRVYAAALRGATDRLLTEGNLHGGPLHVFLAATRSASSISRATPIHALATEVLNRLARLPSGETPTHDRGLAHCAAAQLVDESRGWPSRVESCGLGQIGDEERQAMEAELLGRLNGADDQRMVRLRRLFRTERPAVREAVLGSAARVVHPEAIDLVLEGMGVDDAGVRAAALVALAPVSGWAPPPELVPPPLPLARVSTALTELRRAPPASELETLVSWIATVRAVDARDQVGALQELAVHPNQAVRSAAIDALHAFEADAPSEAPPPPADPLDAPLPPPSPAPRVRLHTSRGDLVLTLRSDVTPTTVARFLELVRSGFYDGLTFHRVVAGFVVQGGDPRGDGYGGPGWSQRCETDPAPYVRGSVGMALAGRDTGGSQFFITHARQPHLDGRYTLFGRVTEGIDILDEIQAGDAILEASVLDPVSE
ncbi:MAG: peptidylprolyl isomerase [Sandaracinaceae bacterium]